MNLSRKLISKSLRVQIGRVAYLTLAIVFLSNVLVSSQSLVKAANTEVLLYPFYDSTSRECGPSTGSEQTASEGPIYMLGDSITVGSTPALESAAGTNGLQFQKINAVTGRSITGVGEGDETGLQALENDKTDISSAKTVVIALGTNPSGANEQGITDVISKIESVNSSASVYWVNIFSPGAQNKETFNSVLGTLSSTLDPSLRFTVIDAAASSIEVGSDNIHPTSAGQTTFAQTVINALKGNASTTLTASGCSCSANTVASGADRDTRYRSAWGYLTTVKGLSEEATAGLMGNLEAESGIDPHNVQNNAKGIPDGPEIPIDAITTDGKPFKGGFGYGIAQWTSPGRQESLIAYASLTNRSTGDLGLQLDFLWKELTESYTGVLAVLQTPEVSIADASYEVLARFETPLPFTDKGSQAGRDQATTDRLALSQKIYDEFSGQTVNSAIGAGCGANGSAIDLESKDTTSIACATGTQDAGVADGYRDGQLYKIRLCSVGGTRVNSQISGSIAKLLADSSSQGAEIGLDSGGGSFRDMEGQISTYLRWCESGGITPTPGPYPKANWSDYTRCPGGAPPGYSNHQLGLGFDFVCDGTLIAQSYQDAQSNECFKWLVANASKYGLYEFGKGENRTEVGYEAWHWSVDGN